MNHKGSTKKIWVAESYCSNVIKVIYVHLSFPKIFFSYCKLMLVYCYIVIFQWNSQSNRNMLPQGKNFYKLIEIYIRCSIGIYNLNNISIYFSTPYENENTRTYGWRAGSQQVNDMNPKIINSNFYFVNFRGFRMLILSFALHIVNTNKILWKYKDSVWL